MFVPGQYRDPDGSWSYELVRGHPLALLVANGPAHGSPFASHLPIILDPAAESSHRLAGATLFGHMNRANPHWASLPAESRVLVVFTGPHAYVSPTVHGVTPAAPTWNFASVHVHGILRKLDSAEQTMEVVTATVRTLEGAFGAGWDMTSSLDYFHTLLPAVGAFRIDVLHAEGMFKLSQDSDPEVRESVCGSFSRRQSSRHLELAELMAQFTQCASRSDASTLLENS
ncbi:FMN-binding negative transcriptional regulator [Lentzea sp. NPDC034063]|uniref:FMN-binding negative transcriptional regulator n=1 Tax=unclassified Lentzea TaxID=2643253 RepID=UPI0034034C3D